MDRIGRYKIVRELGRGAMGVVYHAIDPNIGRPVAIKTIQFGGGRKPEELQRMRDRLFREARSAGILSHPGIVTIYDVDQQDDLAFIAMEYVDGPTLEQVLSDGAALPQGRMYSILGQTAAALDYAHSKGIVHRDIKPANIMLTADGTCKITDFGIAKLTTSEQLTRTGSIVGTPHYMSPEQVQGQAVDGRSDQFSLAVIAYEMMTGEKPYTGEHLTTVVYKIVAEEPVPARRLNPSLTAAIEGALRKGLAKRPDQRYKNCQEFASALETACASSKGWKPMPRSGMLNEPTMADASAVTTAGPASAPAAAGKAAALPPPRHRRQVEATSTTVGAPRRGGFLPFLLAVLVAGGLLALIGWQAVPWFLSERQAGNPPASSAAEPEKKPEDQPAQAQTPAPTQEQPPQPAPGQQAQAQEPQPQTQPQTASSTAAQPGGEAKPSALGPAAKAPAAQSTEGAAAQPPPDVKAAETPKRERKAAMERTPQAGPQEVLVVSSPAGATASLDGVSDSSCRTPCRLQATAGKHTVLISLPGHMTESRDIFVGTGPLEMTPVTLRAATGTLLLTSSPEGAAITINGKRVSNVTPATLSLVPGSYSITVEKDGRQFTDNVVVREGVTTYRKVLLNQ